MKEAVNGQAIDMNVRKILPLDASLMPREEPGGELMTRSLNPMFPLFGMGDTRGYCQSGSVSKEYAVGELASEERYFPRELGLDNTLADTFPCSDPHSSIPDPVFSTGLAVQKIYGSNNK